MKTTKLTWGLYKMRGWCRIKWFFKDTKILISRITFLLKHGYAEPALWESYSFFLDSWEEILKNYRHNRNGTPIVLDPCPQTWNGVIESQNEKAFDDILDSMLADLTTMRLDPLDGNNKEETFKIKEEREAAKNRFFENFSNLFYDLWD